MNNRNSWMPNPGNTRSFRGMSILYGDSRGGALAEHSHAEVQVSVHLRRDLSAVSAAHVSLYASREPHVGGWRRGTEIVVFHFSPDLIMETSEECTRSHSFDVTPLREHHDAALEGLGLIARGEFDKPDRFHDFHVEGIGHVMIGYLLRQHLRVRSGSLPHRGLGASELSRLRAFIRENLHKGFSVREFAHCVSLSPARLSVKLKLATGLSPWRYVQEQRLELAKQLLRSRRMPLLEIADRLGYADQSHLTNAFRKSTGITPQVYRQKL